MTDLFAYAAMHRPNRYPYRAGYKARDTSRAAAQSTEPRAPRLRQLCIDQLMLCGGLTTDECAANMGVDKLSIRPRFSELAALGKVRDSGERRENGSGKRAIVWVLVR